jgi:hypothetical protein
VADGTSCGIGLVCQTGTCVPTSSDLFSEDFADNSQGWTLDPTWQIGPTAVSPPAVFNPDPMFDNTPTADNGVAGVILGGNAPTLLHPYYYLTSPVFDTSGAPGTVVFEYYRWLNSDYTPYMQNQVQVYNGASWVTVWQSAGPPGIQDTAWTLQSFDVTAYKNANMQIRFGYTIGSAGVFTVSSWNVDDVKVYAP